MQSQSNIINHQECDNISSFDQDNFNRIIKKYHILDEMNNIDLIKQTCMLKKYFQLADTQENKLEFELIQQLSSGASNAEIMIIKPINSDITLLVKQSSSKNKKTFYKIDPENDKFNDIGKSPLVIEGVLYKILSDTLLIHTPCLLLNYDYLHYEGKDKKLYSKIILSIEIVTSIVINEY